MSYLEIVDNVTYLVEPNGVRVPYAPPSPYNNLDLPHLQETKISELNEACRKAIEAGFTYEGKLFKSAVDPDQTNIALAGLQIITDPTAVIPWETADNEVVYLTAETFPLFAGAFGQHKMANQVKVSTLKAQVRAIDLQAENAREQLLVIKW